MKKMMSLLMVALVALTIFLELRSTAARLVQTGPNPPVLPVLEAARKDVHNPQDVNRKVPTGSLPHSVREVIIPQHCICCGWYYSKYFTNCNKICCE